MFLFRIQKNEPLKREKVAKVTSSGAGDDKSVRKEPLKKKVKVGRNDPCPCGSGKKYKNCCLDKDMAVGKNTES
jgi:preprotein translocase subunit SecA